MKIVQIYSLSDPDSGEIRYIGKTEGSLQKRLNHHLWEAKRENKIYRHHWINCVLARDKLPIIQNIDSVPENEWEFWEILYISLYKAMGCRLVNLTKGGSGKNGHIPSGNTRRAISESNLGKKKTLSEEGLKSIQNAAKNRNCKQTAESNIKRSEKAKGRKPTDAHRANISRSLKGKPKPYLKGKVLSEGTKEKMRESRKLQTFSIETRQKITNGNIERESRRISGTRKFYPKDKSVPLVLTNRNVDI